MSKVKSAICLTLITLAIAVLCLVCFVPFPVAWTEKEDGTGVPVQFFNPLINWAEKGADLGGHLYGGSDPEYVGGGFSVVFYPEGVISAREYQDDLAAKTGDEMTEYADKYVPYAGGSIYLEKETVMDGDKPSEEFVAAFDAQVKTLKERFNLLGQEDTVFEIRDGYTVRAQLPAKLDASVAAFLYFSYMGEITVSYGTSSEVSGATQIIPETGRKAGPITDYLKSVTSRSNGTTPYVEFDFTDKGIELLSAATASAADSSGYLFVQIGDDTVVNLTVSSQITDDLYISGNYTADSAQIVASVCSTAIKYGKDVSPMSIGDLHREEANFAPLVLGNLALSALDLFYIAFGVCFVAMAVIFFVRYRRLAFAHLLSYLVFVLLSTVVVWAIGLTGGLSLNVGVIAAFAICSALLCITNVVAYEAVRKEFALGKTMISSVKAGYKKTFLSTLDLYVVLVAAGLLLFLIGITELSSFGLAFTLFAALAALCSMLVNRFLWFITMPFAKNEGAFCHFKREEVEDDD